MLAVVERRSLDWTLHYWVAWGVYGARTRRLVYPLVRALGGAQHIQIAREFSHLQWQPTSVLLDRTKYRIAQLIDHVYENVPFYGQMYRTH